MSDPISLALRATALARTPGFNFPGHFLGLEYDRVSARETRVALQAGPHCTDADGQLGIGPFALLADMALAASFRGKVGKTSRIATVSMGLQFTGVPRTGRIAAVASLDGFMEQGRERQGHARVELRSGRKLVATGQGAFMVLGLANATAAHPLPRKGWMKDATIAESALTAHEAEVIALARKSLAARGPFIDRFWGYQPHRTDHGASCTAWNGPHVGNRVGHAQGGFTFGLAVATANAALPAGWHLAGANAWYVGPGIGKQLTARATVVHRGLATAVVHTRIEDEARRGVLEVVTSHLHGKRG